MKSFLITLILLFISLPSFAETKKSEHKYIMVEAEVYDFETNKDVPPEAQVQAGEITQNPKMITEIGKDATIEIGKQDESGQFTELFKLVTSFPENSENYLLELQLIKGDYEKVLTVEATLEKTVLITTSIAGLGKGVRVKTQRLKELPKD